MSQFSFAPGKLDLDVTISAEIKMPLTKMTVLSRKNAGRLVDAGIRRGLREAMPAIEKKLNNAMASRIWGGHTPQESYTRLNGQMVFTGTRNIIDTGMLMSSLELNLEGTALSVMYNSPYAKITYYGGVIHPYGNKKATAVLPPKPWIAAAIKGMGPIKPFNFQPYISRGLKAAWRSL